MHRHGVEILPVPAENPTLLSKCLFSSCLLSAPYLCHYSGRDWKHQDKTSSYSGENSEESWFTVWILHARNCHVNVRLTA